MEFSGSVGGVDMTDNVTWTGIDKFTRFLRETPGLVVKDLEAAMFQEGENIMGISKRNTPVDDQILRPSGHVKLPETKGGKTSVMLAYGTDYAWYVHESGPREGGPGEKKFLENAMNSQAKGWSARMQKRILARITRRGG